MRIRLSGIKIRKILVLEAVRGFFLGSLEVTMTEVMVIHIGWGRCSPPKGGRAGAVLNACAFGDSHRLGPTKPFNQIDSLHAPLWRMCTISYRSPAGSLRLSKTLVRFVRHPESS